MQTTTTMATTTATSLTDWASLSRANDWKTASKNVLGRINQESGIEDRVFLDWINKTRQGYRN